MKNFKSLIALSILIFAGSFALAQKAKFPKEKEMGAYLMVYFKDDTHGLYMALSKDGYSFTDVNNAKPIIAGDTIAEQKGIRDPYIYRAPDGMFYLALTDLHIYGQKEGYRTTEWERDGKQYGWGNNRGLVLMKSPDLIHWSHTVLRVDQAFPELADIGCAWAPELIYDEKENKTMIYFTMRFGTQKNKVYYSYMNKDFTKIETLPKSIFEYPEDKEYIDADITKAGGKYHMLIASHNGGSHIEQAISDSINSGYQLNPQRVDGEKVGCEAPNVYKLIGQNKWMLIYDIYRINPHNFGFSETSDFVNFKSLGHFNEGVMKSTNFSVPKHPSVIQITKKEAQKLAKNWNCDIKF
ncbi:glycoside hydrolase family 43 protein [Flavobacterium marginilacus]|uniref:glycoside hydrolase family 43 protein n=1 Tax=Flavobacterium marginilacus TaxID=3003256 RepID=UPI00248DE1FA|nr:glycoside hydrolase family 43 protein [Flavobacterium marginilacus]